MGKSKKTEENATPIVRNYKDTMFRLLFKDKENLLSLYNAVNNTHYEDKEQLEIVTLENAVFMNIKNDLAFVMDFYLNIYEHQSTVNPNMPLRDLFYVSKELSVLVDSEELYYSKLVKIPTPRFYVFYNGTTDEPETQTLRLSDAFAYREGEPELELKVQMLNINKGKNQVLMERCTVLREYMLFVEKVRSIPKIWRRKQRCMAVDECIREGILRDFLMKHKREAIEVCVFEYDEEKVMRYIRQEEYKRGKEEGERIGREEYKMTMIVNMLKDGIPDEKICEYTECEPGFVEEIRKALVD